METTLAEFLKTQKRDRLAAKNPIKPELFKFIPFFDEVFEKELWPILANLSGSDGIAHIECKECKPGQVIIKKGEFDMMVFWLLKGTLEVVSEIEGISTVINRYDETGFCFGELSIVEGCERTADVNVDGNKGATIIEIDWSITAICHELESRFNLLLMKTINRKLMKNFSTCNRTYAALKIIKRESDIQAREVEKLKKLLKKNNIKFDDAAAFDLPEKIGEVAEDIDKSAMEG